MPGKTKRAKTNKAAPKAAAPQSSTNKSGAKTARDEPKVNNSQTLPPKEGLLFKTILVFYTQKEDKKR